jgi:dihydrodipicolinate synthase/N-acetylneuraminate lyase
MDPVSATLLVTTIAAGAGGAIMQRNAAIAQSHQMKAQAAREGDAARQREIERRRALLRALSSQSARAGAGGVALDGSLAGIARADIRDATNDLLIDRSNTRSRQNELIRGAKNARSQGNIGAAVSLFDTGAKVAGQL